MIAVRPQWPINRANAILFASFSGIRGTSQYKTKYFILVFRDRKEYNKACKKLFSRSTDDAGASRTKAKYDMVLVAGDWTELDKSEYSAYGVKSGEHIYGAQISDFYSRNQISPFPSRNAKKSDTISERQPSGFHLAVFSYALVYVSRYCCCVSTNRSYSDAFTV